MTTLTARLELASSKNAARVPAFASAISKPTGPSNLVLFLTNLRLLDLDCREDWPGITAATFSTKNTQQNQKSRVQCVEWALFQLFAIWDPVETKDKLQPFFPPLEPLQSLNLRAALFRCLDHAKKNGVLGRDAVLRKTMLDECKGERLEEVLAVFSAVILKKVVVETMNMDAIALQLAMENFSYFGERTMLTALVLAHKASLAKELRRKNEARTRYREFAALLDEKQSQFLARHELLKQSIASREDLNTMPQREMDILYDRVQKNWAGSNEWLETICHGDRRFERDGLMAKPYEETWKQVVDGTLSEAENKKSKGLLEQLDARVQEQQHRLNKWRNFEKSLNKPGTPKPQLEPKDDPQNQRGIDLGFTVHLEISFQKENDPGSKDTKPKLLVNYGQLLSKMKAELENVGKLKPKVSGRQERQLTVQDEDFGASMADGQRDTNSETLSDTSEKQKSDLRDNNSDAGWQSQEDDEPFEEEEGEEMHEKVHISPETAIPSIEVESGSESDAESTFSAIIPHKQETPEPEAESQISGQTSARASPSPQPEMVDESEADRILKSMAAASPSPVKRSRHKLSLAERTQLSMSRSSQSFSEDLSDEPDDFPSLALRPIVSPQARDIRQLDPNADLIERTRQSMSGFAAAQKKAQLDRRQSLRSAKKTERAVGNFPPPFQSPGEDEVGQDSGFDRNALIEGSHEVDYESAFKSRPKIALSPSISPIKWDDGNVSSHEVDDENAFKSRPKIALSPAMTPVKWDPSDDDSVDLSSPLGKMRR